jgi:hypothetical protein
MATASPTFNLISSENVEGAIVYAPNGNEIGEIDHLVLDKISGNIRYAVMSFGGFAGLGHGHYPIPWNALEYDSEREGYITDVTEDQLKDAPEFSDDSWTDRNWEARWHQHFQTRPYWDEQRSASEWRDPTNPARPG